MSKLFNNENLEKININTNYARNYNNWRQKEELHKLKARYGEDIELKDNLVEEFSESSEDDEGEEIPELFEKSFYKTLAFLKNKDPKIYDKGIQFFIEPEKKNTANGTRFKETKKKSLFLRDYERRMIVERGAKFSEDEIEKQNNVYNLTYAKEQLELKYSFKKLFQNSEDNQEENLLIIPKIKTKEETEKEEKDYKEWLKGHIKDINKEEQKDLKSLRDFWADPNLNVKEKFLRDYVLNKKFLEKQSTDYDPEYDHVVHDSDENLSEDERNINQQEEFEHKYNFRFEEPDQEFIKSYPRTLENSLRTKDSRRAQKRAEVKIRKEQEKIKKKEELKQLKALKRKEIEEKLEKIKEITGNDHLKLNLMDLEGDFDPDEYDKKMNEIFNEEYYTKEDAMKPEFPNIDDELCIESTWDDYDPITEEFVEEEIPYHEVHCEDSKFNMDAEYDGQNSLQVELVQSSKKRKRRRRSKFAEMILKEKPKYDPIKYTSYKEYYDQYYALDYEDTIGDLPCRFKYRKVVPNDYGLSIEEILMADDKELNKWCSLKRALEYKSEFKELNDIKTYKQKANNETFKRKILKSLYSIPEVNISTECQNLKQNIKQENKHKRKNELHKEIKTDVNKNSETNIKVEKSLKGSQNIKKIDKCDMQMDKSFIVSNKRKLDESLEKIEESKLVSKKNSNGNIENKYFVEQLQCAVVQKESYVKNIKTPIKQLNKVENNEKNKLNKLKNKNAYIEKGILNKKEKRREKFMKSKKKKINDDNKVTSLSSERLKAYGLNPKKFINKLKYMKKR